MKKEDFALKQIMQICIGVLLFIIASTIIISCNKKKNNDPCYGKKVTADFDIFEEDEDYAKEWFKTDSCIRDWVRFAPKYKNATAYEWTIGNKKFYNDTIALDFYSAFDGQVIPVTLKVTQKPDAICYPNDSSVITFTKNLYIDNNFRYYFGKWVGYYIDDPTNQDTITIEKGNHGVLGDSKLFGLTPALDTNMNDPFKGKTFYGEIYQNLDVTKIKKNFRGYYLVGPTKNEIQIKFECYGAGIPSYPLEIISRVFIGKRLN
jgi:hypothetical protein